MKMKSELHKSVASRLHLPLLNLFLFLSLTASLLADQKYLTAGKPDGITLLPQHPVPGTAEYAADLNCARAVFNGKTAAEEKRATKLASLTIFNFSEAIGDFFTPEKCPKTDEFFKNIKPEIKSVIDPTKHHWNRKRPYEVDSSLTLGKPEASSSYPSGHSTVGTVQAFLLAELFPDKREEILKIGREIGWSRVVIGKHFPSDVQAGRVLGQAIAREFLASEAFQKDFAEIKAEVQTARGKVAAGTQ